MGDLFSTLCLGVLLLIGLALLSRLFKRSEPPAGTYDSKKYQSGGSIGGMRGGRAHDSPDFDSGGTIGGDRERRAYDRPDIRSGGSIGGGPSAGERPRQDDDRVQTEDGDWQTSQDRPRYRTTEDKGRIDSPDVKSGGSFGG